MNSHKHAALTPMGRALLVRRVLHDGWKVAEASHAAGVSERTGYKWLARFKAEGALGLLDRRSRPDRCPHETSPQVRQHCEQLRLLQDAPTVTGPSMLAQADAAPVCNDQVIRPLGKPFSTQPAIVIIKGNLGAEGAIVKMGLTADKVTRFRGPARIDHSREDALARLACGEIKRGNVVVMRCMGVRGGPGMSMASALVFALDGAGMGADVAVITDGELSGLVNRGLVVGKVTPETLAGDPLWAARDSDIISIDVPARSITLEVPDVEIARRLAQDSPPEPARATGWLSIYQRIVQPLSRGASLIPIQEELS